MNSVDLSARMRKLMGNCSSCSFQGPVSSEWPPVYFWFLRLLILFAQYISGEGGRDF